MNVKPSLILHCNYNQFFIHNPVNLLATSVQLKLPIDSIASSRDRCLVRHDEIFQNLRNFFHVSLEFFRFIESRKSRVAGILFEL